jgi:ubiquinol-cytochrome c reductase iron-sulfur subunit
MSDTPRRRPVRPSGHMPPREPAHPVDTTDARSLPWMAGWSLLGVVGLALAVWAVVTGARTEVQALAAASVPLAAAIVLHHLIVTRDAGELSVDRDVHLQDELAEDRLLATLGRRPLLVRGALGAGAIGALAALGGVRFLGPRRGTGSAWEPGAHVVTTEGDRLRPEDIPVGGVVTGWPEGSIDVETAAVMVLRLRDEPLEPTNTDGVVDGFLIAYSRICTHAGCPVALYRDQDQALFCPCHQATFDARRAGTPTFGPASGPLPQLPLGVDGEGFLIALDDFPITPGPVGGET